MKSLSNWAAYQNWRHCITSPKSALLISFHVPPIFCLVILSLSLFSLSGLNRRLEQNQLSGHIPLELGNLLSLKQL